MNETARLTGGITRLRLPMRNAQTPYVNVYLLEDDDGFAMIDCGWATEDVRVALETGLEEAGIAPRQIRRLIATHYHHDHAGNSGPVVRMSGAALLMSTADRRMYERETADMTAEMQRREAWLHANGLEARPGLEERVAWFNERYDPAPVTTELSDGDILQIGTQKLEVVITPGHTIGHVCLLDRERDCMFTGDHVLPEIVPHIGNWGINDPNPLGSYVASLRKVAGLGISSALPGHYDPISDLRGRCEELIAEIEKRQFRVLSAFQGTTWMSGAEVARRMPWGRGSSFDDLKEVVQSLVMASVLAQLSYLESAGHIERDPSSNRYRVR